MTIRGVYKYIPTEDEFRITLETQCGRDLSWWQRKKAEKQVRDHFEHLYLIEVHFESGDPRPFDWGRITQNLSNVPPSNRQDPWDEQQVGSDPKDWAFYFHFLEIGLPLSTPAGDMDLPKPSPIPEHLASIRYEAPG